MIRAFENTIHKQITVCITQNEEKETASTPVRWEIFIGLYNTQEEVETIRNLGGIFLTGLSTTEEEAAYDAECAIRSKVNRNHTIYDA